MARQGFSTLAEYCVQNGGLQEKECGADGNCFYHCLAAANDMREWDGLDSLDEAAREEARGKLQQQVSCQQGQAGHKDGKYTEHPGCSTPCLKPARFKLQ